MAVITNILELKAGNTPQTLAELKQSIKNLKNELLNLEQDSELYNETLLKTGELTHQLKEIQEQISRTTGDFGDNLSQMNNTLAGGVASITAITSSLSLMGVQMGSDEKLMKTLVSAMSLTQALSSIDKAQKGFKALTITIKGSITAAGGLGKALKMLAVSNPFTAILAAATAVIAVFAKIQQKSKEASEQMAQDQEDAAQRSKEAWNDAFQNAKAYFDYLQRTQKANTDYWNYDEFTKIANAIKASGKTSQEIELNVKGLSDKRAALQGDAKYTKEAIQVYKDFDKAFTEMLANRWNLMEADYHRGAISQEQFHQQMEQIQEEYGSQKKSYEAYQNELSAYQKKKQDEANRRAKENKDKREKEKQDEIAKNKKLEDDSFAHQKTLLEQSLAEQKSLIEKSYQEKLKLANGDEELELKAEIEKNNSLYNANKDYYEKLKTLTEGYKNIVNNRDTDGTELSLIDNLNSSIQSINDSLQDGQYSWENYSKQATKSLENIQKSKAQAQLDKDSLEQDSELLRKTIENNKDYYKEYLELVKKSNSEFSIRDIELQNQQDLLEIQKQGLDNQETNLKFSLENKLISIEEYNNGILELENNRLEIQEQMDELEIEREKNKLDKKKSLQEKYVSAVGAISSSMVSVLNGLADAEGVSFEQSKKIKIASATISTIQGALDAFMSCQGSYPQPYGAIIGAIQAAAVTATGMLEIQKIKSTTKNTSSGSVSAPTAATIVQSAPTNVSLSGVEQDFELPEQKVYVVESDITNAQKRVRVQEENARF